MGAPDAGVPQQPFQNRLDCFGFTEDLLDPGATAAESKHHEVADRCLAGTLAVDDDGNTALEVGLADEELAATGELADG
jgi:hypothetical protein